MRARRHTEPMRVYIPATRHDLDADVLEPLRVHAVTPQLQEELADDDEEVLELVAFLAAADESVQLIAERNDLARRVVISADVEPGGLVPPAAGELETILLPTWSIRWEQVAAIHADDALASDDVAAAAQGDDDAFERLGEHEMLWYDATERDDLRAQLGEA